MTARSAGSFVAKLLGVILIALALLFLPSILDADTVYQQADNFAATGSGRTINLIASGIDYHRIAFYPIGSPAACTVKLEKSSDGAAWTDLIAATACTSSGITAATLGLHAYVRLTVTALTASTSVRVAYLGYRGNPGGGSLSSVDQGAAGIDPWLVTCNNCGGSASVLMADNTANPTIPQSAAFGMLFDGVTWDRAPGDSTNGAYVNIKANATDFATQTTLALIKAKTDNIDVALSTRTKPADQQHVIVDSITAGATRIGKVTIRNAADLADIDPLAESTFTTRINTQGQKAMAASTPVVIASDQTAFPVTANAGTNLNTSLLLLDATYTGRMPAGASPADNESNTNTALSRIGTFTYVFDGLTWDRWTGAVTANAGTNLNTSLLLLDSTFTGRINTQGQKAMAASTPVVIASDQSKITTAISQTTTDNDVDVTSVVPGTGATNLGKAEDAVHASGDVGVFALSVANEAQTTLAADGDYIAEAVDTKGNPLVVGNIAHDGVDAGAPVKIGGKASPPATLPTKVSATGDRVNAWYDNRGRAIVATQKLITYSAVYRLAVNNAIASLTATLTANTDKEYATIYHTAGSAKEVQIRKVIVWLNQSTVASDLNIELREISAATAPATGNPVITPRAHDSVDAAAEAACLALPTTAGSEAAVNSPLSAADFHLGAAAAGTTVTPINGLVPIVLYDSSQVDNDMKNPTMRVGVAMGYGVWIRASGASDIVRATIQIVFTEETP